MPLDTTSGSAPPPIGIDWGRDDRPRKDEPFIMPSISHVERQTREEWRGMITIRYQVMALWDPCYMSVTDQDDPAVVQKARDRGSPIVRLALVDSDRYRGWLARWHRMGEILPHICWGGHITSTPGGDGGRGYAAWKLHALTLR